MKCNYKDIKDIMDWCKKYGKEWGAHELLGKSIGGGCDIAYYTPRGANWCYRVEMILYRNQYYKIITVFGEIRAFIPASIPEILA